MSPASYLRRMLACDPIRGPRQHISSDRIRFSGRNLTARAERRLPVSNQTYGPPQGQSPRQEARLGTTRRSTTICIIPPCLLQMSPLQRIRNRGACRRAPWIKWTITDISAPSSFFPEYFWTPCSAKLEVPLGGRAKTVGADTLTSVRIGPPFMPSKPPDKYSRPQSQARP